MLVSTAWVTAATGVSVKTRTSNCVVMWTAAHECWYSYGRHHVQQEYITCDILLHRYTCLLFNDCFTILVWKYCSSTCKCVCVCVYLLMYVYMEMSGICNIDYITESEQNKYSTSVHMCFDKQLNQIAWLSCLLVINMVYCMLVYLM